METKVDSNVQQYIDGLKEALLKAEQNLAKLKESESKSIIKYARSRDLATFLKKLLDQLLVTSGLGVSYLDILDRSAIQIGKVGSNAVRSINAIKNLILDSKKNLDCIEVLAKLIKELGDKTTNCKIPVKEDPKSVMSIIKQLKEETEKAVTANRDMVIGLLTTLQLQDVVGTSLHGKRGLVFQLRAMERHMKTGSRYDQNDHDDPESDAKCGACEPKGHIFPMDDARADFYTSLEKAYKYLRDSLPGLKETMSMETAKRERLQAKKEALAAALKAAIEAKSCEIKK